MSVDTGPKTGPERPSVHMGPFSVDPFFAGTVWIRLTFRTGSGAAPCKLLLDKLQTVSSTEAIPVRNGPGSVPCKRILHLLRNRQWVTITLTNSLHSKYPPRISQNDSPCLT